MTPRVEFFSRGVTIRPLDAWAEFQAAENLERVVWQMPDWRDAVPANLLIAAQKNGGLVLGAFVDARLVGFAFSFLARDAAPASLKHHSHMLAVLPEFQSRGIGLELKLAQRAICLTRGIDLMTWTFDPLQALNANLNLWRLGAHARHYLADAYGEMSDGLNAGLASDRFIVEWKMNDARVRACAQTEPARLDWANLLRDGAREIFSVAFDAPNVPRVRDQCALDGDTLLIEIPAQINALKTASLAVAREWRARTRAVFQNAFASGYRAENFVYAEQNGARRAAYVLRRDDRR
ncbi:MAG: GNAT family N-acetyltransferase [Chloroflexi bacterium]|nr:GNAT family N-acetyltransferase [Chloroflexota bacterium]